MTESEVLGLKEATKALTTWDSSNVAFGHVASIDVKKDYYIFEFFCLMRILKGLGRNYIIEFKKGRKYPTAFPGGPAKMKDYPYFSLVEKEKLKSQFWISYGTTVILSDASGSNPSPDISFLSKEPNLNVTEKDLLLIMDAKFKKNPSSPLSKTIMGAFLFCVHDCKLESPKAFRIDFTGIEDFNGNCLITNGKVILKHAKKCKEYRVKLIGYLDHENEDFEVVG